MFLFIWIKLDPSARTDHQIQIKMHGQRYAERYQNIYKHFGHSFVAKIFKTPTFCSICGDCLWYKQTFSKSKLLT